MIRRAQQPAAEAQEAGQATCGGAGQRLGVSQLHQIPASANQYDVVLVSPRNFFLYTPLLPAVATGTMEERSIVEPVRNFVQGKAEFYQALAKDVDPVAKELVCCFPDDNGFPEACFKISYDVLVVS
ncbi:uncharacterized protein HaLaN_26100, partial [Haematococcus lacustris]